MISKRANARHIAASPNQAVRRSFRLRLKSRLFFTSLHSCYIIGKLSDPTLLPSIASITLRLYSIAMSTDSEAQLLSLCKSLRPALSLSPDSGENIVNASLAQFAVERHRVGPLLRLACRHGCCQSNRNLSPIGIALPFPDQCQAISVCHSARAAERAVL